MLALDTNILARFYVDDPSDPEAQKQRPIAHHLLDGQGRAGYKPSNGLRTPWPPRLSTWV
jgi:hypothetical protein